MKKNIFLFLILLTTESLFGQWATPLGYTSFLKLRYYSYQAQPGPDSVKQNLLDIDNFAKRTYDTLETLRANVYTTLKYNGTLKEEVIEYDDFNPVLKNKLATKDLNETFTGTKTFTASVTYTKDLQPYTSNTYNLGHYTNIWRRGYFGNVYANNFIVQNPSNPSDTMIITYDGSNVTFDKSVHFINGMNITGTMAADSFKIGSALRYTGYTLVVNRGDSISLVLNNYSLFYLNPSDDVPVLKYLDYYVPTAPGTVVILVNISSSYTITLKDEVSGGNLYLANDFTMGPKDIICLLRIYLGFNSYGWVEMYRSNN